MKTTNKRMAAIIILTLMISLFFGMLTIAVIGDMVLENIVAQAPYTFNGIYGGVGGKILELAEHLPEYEWLVKMNNAVNNMFAAAVESTVPITFVAMMIDDWFYEKPSSK